MKYSIYLCFVFAAIFSVACAADVEQNSVVSTEEVSVVEQQKEEAVVVDAVTCEEVTVSPLELFRNYVATLVDCPITDTIVAELNAQFALLDDEARDEAVASVLATLSGKVVFDSESRCFTLVPVVNQETATQIVVVAAAARNLSI